MTTHDVCIPGTRKAQWFSHMLEGPDLPAWLNAGLAKRDKTLDDPAIPSNCRREFSGLIPSEETGSFIRPDVRNITDLDKEDFDSIFDSSAPWGAEGLSHEMND